MSKEPVAWRAEPGKLFALMILEIGASPYEALWRTKYFRSERDAKEYAKVNRWQLASFAGKRTSAPKWEGAGPVEGPQIEQRSDVAFGTQYVIREATILY